MSKPASYSKSKAIRYREYLSLILSLHYHYPMYIQFVPDMIVDYLCIRLRFLSEHKKHNYIVSSLYKSKSIEPDIAVKSFKFCIFKL